ncbi:DUF2470 domain-containing protein [Streptomyces hainanensis]|uniref:DUF2470 domain-containing protein n=1 Tax=Streptomyces hainanensis TaxID=402648 RepID=A0A4V2Y036_9ACTN|nr:DUF2470 domain-containing protein [Streptomyces hainanensis]TDC63315.1 DUF2470 domain-containing protein [Streptomyces hainanensis]
MIRPGSPRSDSGHRSRGEGQPRPGHGARQPTAAERVRTLVESNASAALTIPGAELGHSVPESRAVSPAGDVLLLVPADSPAARATPFALDDDVTAVMEITDVAPVSVPHRIRGRGWVAGWLTAVPESERCASVRLLAERHPAGPVPGPAWTLLCLEIGEAYTDDLWGAAHVEPDEFTAATADPLAPHEAELLQHLAAAHGEQLRSLCALLGDRGAACDARQGVTPLALDRHGLRIRFSTGTACFDARFDFPAPVSDVADLRHAMRQLFEAAATS